MPAAPGRPGPAFYLAGDSFPDDVGVERALEPRLSPHLGGWVGQAALAGGRFDAGIAARVAQLEAALPAGPALARTVLIGRSSGARVVTEVACRRPVLAVICLGYPFRRPGAAEEPARFAHLARLSVPTLILQGSRDDYGTPAAAGAHPLSPAIRVEALDADHRLRLAAPAWDAACRLIRAFWGLAAEGALRWPLTG
ncbi:alpha/beta family hydrolase [Falsiroseomonas ponticola]|uniref:alpha/beta family hydrolase n=1 Tax=Falsiroseomonas ponticola TaxID=2786951 RepID=UPI001933328F|nr:alpha/beta family hydrolase [Roseomonas ponticola]